MSQWRSGRPRSPRGCGGGATLQGAPERRLLGVTKKKGAPLGRPKIVPLRPKNERATRRWRPKGVFWEY